MAEFSKSIEIKKEKAKSIPETVGTWWKEVSVAAGTQASPGKLYAVGKYVVELTRNSLGDGKSDGKITASFDAEKITIEIEALTGEGREINLNVGGSYGMKETIEYADDFFIEAGGNRWEKAPVKALLEEEGESNVQDGSKVTFIKYIGAPPVEEDEEEEVVERYMGNRKW